MLRFHRLCMFIKIILRIISSFVMYGLSWHEFWYEKLSTTIVNWKILCCLHLVPPMPLYYGLEDSPCSTEWIDVYYKHICGKFWTLSSLLLMNR